MKGCFYIWVCAYCVYKCVFACLYSLLRKEAISLCLSGLCDVTADNLTYIKRKWILTNFRGFENAGTYQKLTNASHTDPSSRQSIYKLRNKFGRTGTLMKVGIFTNCYLWEKYDASKCDVCVESYDAYQTGVGWVKLLAKQTGRLWKQLNPKPHWSRFLYYLMGDDPDCHMQFAKMQNNIHEKLPFLYKIVWSDEACLKFSDNASSHNCVSLHDEYLHLTVAIEMNQPSVTEWAGRSFSSVLELFLITLAFCASWWYL